MAFLTKEQVKQIVDKRPQGASPAGVVAALVQQGHQLEGYQNMASTGPGPEKVAPIEPGTTVKSLSAAALPVMGMSAGGMLGARGGPVGARAGAALGGMAGTAGQIALTGNPEDALRRILTSGAMGAGMEGAGQLVGKGMSGIGQAVMGKALGVAPGLAKRFPRMGQKGITQEALKGKARVSDKGYEVASQRRQASAKAENDLLTKADQSGMRVGVQQIAKPVLRKIEKANGRPLTAAERQRAIDEVRQVVVDALERRTFGVTKVPPNVSAITPSATQDVKQITADLARSEFGAEHAGKAVSANPALQREVSRGARGALPQNVRDQAGQTQKSIAVEQAIADALARGERMVQAHVPVPFTGMQVPLPVKMSQDAMSGWANRFDDPNTQGMIQLLMKAGLLPFTQPPDTTGSY